MHESTTHLHQLLARRRLVEHALGVLREVHAVLEAEPRESRLLRA